MIARNEAHQIEEILSQCKGFADEIVVVDTGSTDNTKGVISKYTEKVFDFEWCDDFSAARNFSLRKATGGYAVIIDADDRLTPDNQERINKLRKYMDGERMFNFALRSMDQDGHAMGMEYYQPRCLPLRDDIYYEGRVHNQVTPSILRANLKVCEVNIDVNHVGYADPEVYKAKQERTAHILHLEHEEDPTNGRVNMYLGLHSEKAGEPEDARDYFEVGVSSFEPNIDRKPFGLFECYAGLVRVYSKLARRDKALEYFKKLWVFIQGAPERVALGVTALAEEYDLYDECQFLKKQEEVPELDVVLVGNNDWANVGYEFSQALQAVGVKAKMLIGASHLFEYPEQGMLVLSPRKVGQYLEKAKVIQFMHSQFAPTDVDLKDKRVFVFHGGTAYRQNAEMINKFFNPIVQGSIIQSTNLIGLGAKNEHWLLPCINANNYEPNYKRVDNERLIIGQFHYNTKGKKTEIIGEVIKKLNADPETTNKFSLIQDTKRVVWKNNIQRFARCDVIIDQFGGVWGLTTLEAAALGKIVLTSFDGIKAYEKEYGECSLVIVQNNLDDIVRHLKHLILLSDDELVQMKQASRAWVERFHCYEFIGNKLREIYGL